MPPLASASPTSAAATPASAAAGAAGAGAVFGRTRAPPRAAAVASRLTVVPRGGDGRGDEATLAIARTLLADAAVGLLNRERSTFRGALGGSGGGGALRDLASEAAVGANRPEEGSREGREVAAAAAFFDDGVFGREPGVAATTGVGDLALMLAVVERGRVDGALRIPFEGVLRGVGVLERVARVAVAVAAGGRVLGNDVDFEGDAGVLADLGGAVYGRDVEGADTRGLIGFVVVGAGAGASTGTGTGASCGTMDPLPSTVDGIMPGAAEESDLGAKDAGGTTTRPGGVPSSDVVVGTKAAAEVIGVPRNVAAEGGGLGLVLVVPLALPLPFVLTVTGGHSRAMRCSSFTASLVLFDVALVARDGGPEDVGWRFCCCSKRPMRFATDCRGRSSGSGLLEEVRRIRRSDGKMKT
jgi:hypothetical protein